VYSFTRSILGAAAITIVSGCSSDPFTPSAPEGVAVPSTNLSTLTVPDAGQADPNAAKAALGDPNVRGRLRGMGLQASSVAGVASPTTMQLVAASDHQVAQTVISGAMINDHAPVYVIEMTGGPFTAIQHPPGGTAPQGNVLTLTVDAQTFRVTDIGYHPVAHDLTQMDSDVVDLMAPRE
jgi:hypothetical protein